MTEYIGRVGVGSKKDEDKWAIISKTSVLTQFLQANQTMPQINQIRFLWILTLWTCFPSMFDMSKILKLSWSNFWRFCRCQLRMLLIFFPNCNSTNTSIAQRKVTHMLASNICVFSSPLMMSPSTVNSAFALQRKTLKTVDNWSRAEGTVRRWTKTWPMQSEITVLPFQLP